MSIRNAWKAYEKGDRDRARELLQKSAANAGRSSQPFTQLGLFFLRTEAYEDACQSFRKGVDIEPLNPAPLFFLALAQELAGRTGEARSLIEKLKEVSPHHQGRTTLELLIALRGGDPLPLLAEFGFGSADKEGGSARPLQKLSASLGIGDPEWLPSDLSASDYLLGPILVEVETKLHPLEIPQLYHHPDPLPEEPSSLEPLKRSLKEELRGMKASHKAGYALRKGKRYLEKGFSLSDREEQRRLLHKAAVYLRAARKADKFSFRVSYHLAETYTLLAKGEPGQPYSRFRLQQAESSILESARHEGVNPYLFLYLGFIQHMLGRLHLAIKYYQAATKKFEKLPEAYYGEGQCRLLLGERGKARELLLKAVNSDYLEVAQERLGMYATVLSEKGPEFFDKAFPVMPPEPDPLPKSEPESLSEADPGPEPELEAETTPEEDPENEKDPQ